MIICAACSHANTDDSTFCTECRSALKLKDDVGTVNTPNPNDYLKPEPLLNLELAPGTLFADRYTIVEKIGQGGMGVVYHATEQLGANPRNVALKLIRADQRADPGALDRLMNEGALTQDIRHNNVVAVYNVGVTKDPEPVPFVAMEYVDGVSLREWIRRQRYADTQKDPPPMALIASLIRSILDGLKAAHERGVIHRDLKPENVILTADPTTDAAPLKILDFGIARASGKVDVLTGTGMATPDYMAQEQRTDPAGVNASTDLFALSRMFYELLMGVLPSGHWQAPSGGRSDVPEAVDTLIQQGLSTSQRMRPQSAADYRAALDKALGGPVKKPVKPNNLLGGNLPPDPPPPSGKLLNKPLLFGLGGAAALVLVIAVGIGGGTNQYEILSGQWNYANGSYLEIGVDADGNFSGSGVSADNVPVDMAGSLSAGQFTIGNAQYGQMGGTITAGVSPCHLDFETYNQDGSLNWKDTFHIDHAAGQDCPARFGG